MRSDSRSEVDGISTGLSGIEVTHGIGTLAKVQVLSITEVT